GRRGGGQRLRPLRPVDRLPADGPADLSGRRPGLRQALPAEDARPGSPRPSVGAATRRALRARRLAIHPRPGGRAGERVAALSCFPPLYGEGGERSETGGEMWASVLSQRLSAVSPP